jgi:chromosomal replication initiator protein
MSVIAECNKIKAEVARKHMISVKDLESKSRKEEFVVARNEAIFRCRQETKGNLSSIGRQFCRSHATVIHAIKSFENGNGKDMYRDLGSN